MAQRKKGGRGEMGSSNSIAVVSYSLASMRFKPYTFSYTSSILCDLLSTRNRDSATKETHLRNHFPLIVLYPGWDGGVVGSGISHALAGGSLKWWGGRKLSGR